MTVFILDTNVLSEAGKPSPNRNVRAFLIGLVDLWISVVSIHEIEYGIRLLPSGQRRSGLERSMAAVIATFGSRIMSVGEDEARRAAHFRAESRRRGRMLHLPDALIAATAKEHGLTLATCNLCDFEHLGIEVVNPWAA
jgi:predicted nucleic acid-binding protein